jgi:hypothetical protein
MPDGDHRDPQPSPVNALAAIAATEEGRAAVAKAMIGKLREMVRDPNSAPQLARAVQRIMHADRPSDD